MTTIPKKILYSVIAICSLLVCIIAVILFLIVNSNSLELSVKDGETITLQYGIDSAPVVTALYWDSIFDKTGTPVEVTAKGNLDLSKPGKYSITYTATYADQTVHATQTIIVKDTVAPTLQLIGEDNIILAPGTFFTDPGVIAIDDVDGDISANIVTESNIDPNVCGRQHITYSAQDSSGNISQIKRTVIIQEFIPPTLTLAENNCAFVKLGENYAEPGYTATDNADGDITGQVVVTGEIDNTTIGTYNLTYTATDSSNNVTTANRTVYVYAPQGDEFAVEPNGKIVYLSFDDGPGPYTQQLLDILDKYNVKVTFFVTGQDLDYTYLVGEAYRRGHTIAMHTYSHVFSEVYASETAYYEDLNRIKELCISQTGEAPTIVRFPGGTSNNISRNYCRGIMSALTYSLPYNGYQYCDWNIDSNDAGGATDAATVAYNVISCLPEHQNSFVLQHDTKLYSVEAVEQIICWGLANGYTFMPMDANTPMYHHPANN